MTGRTPDVIPTDYGAIYPEVDGYLYKPLLVTPPLCTYKELHELRLYDIEVMHQIIDIKNHRSESARQAVTARQPTMTGV